MGKETLGRDDTLSTSKNHRGNGQKAIARQATRNRAENQKGRSRAKGDVGQRHLGFPGFTKMLEPMLDKLILVEGTLRLPSRSHALSARGRFNFQSLLTYLTLHT